MNPCEFSLSVTAIANAIASSLSDDNLDVAASIFSQISSTLSFISVQRQQCHKLCDSGDSSSGEDPPPIPPNPLIPLL